MVCVPVKIMTPLQREVYDNDWQVLTTLIKCQRHHVQYEHRGPHLSAAFLPTYIENQHGVFPSKVLNRTLPVEKPQVTYRITLH